MPRDHAETKTAITCDPGDFILVLAGEIETNYAEIDRLDLIHTAATRAGGADDLGLDLVQTRLTALCDRNQALTGAIASTQATSLAGALVQIRIALCEADALKHSVDGNANDLNDMILVTKHLASAVYAIEQHTGIRPDEYAGGAFAVPHAAAMLRAPETSEQPIAIAAE
ncbi:MAG: hypothetical protein JWL84_1511 [Rhodospirillales bacterium]|nr:hypothetical protein [Rhodospirillales bacterium]